MNLTIYQIDAFAENVFEGNPAAVIPLDKWLSDEIMQALAAENNLAETAFFVADKNKYHIRWFTPTREVNLCGHATLASAFVLFNLLGNTTELIEFSSLSDILSVKKDGDLLTLDFPSQIPQVCELPEDMVKGLGLTPLESLKNEDYLVLLENEEALASLKPDFSYLQKLDLRGVIATAPSTEFDFVARFFAPKFGIPEDPVTGSAYTQLTPYWSQKLGKSRLSAKQISSRGGKLLCELNGDRVLISGKAVKYLEGEIEIP